MLQGTYILLFVCSFLFHSPFLINLKEFVFVRRSDLRNSLLRVYDVHKLGLERCTTNKEPVDIWKSGYS